jgi:hypothetical protein
MAFCLNLSWSELHKVFKLPSYRRTICLQRWLVAIETTTTGPATARQRQPKQSFRVVFVIAGLLILPAALTLDTVVRPGVLQITSDNPTPRGYTWSLLLFIVPTAALGWWFARRRDLRLARKSFWRTIAVLVADSA